MDRSLDEVIDEALEQVSAVCRLDAPRAEAWASDLISLATETVGVDSVRPSDPVALHLYVVDELLRRFDESAGVAGSVAAGSVRALVGAGRSIGRIEPGLPRWFAALGTSRCNGAWSVVGRRGESAVFHFTDDVGATHEIAVDLASGEHEAAGEVVVGTGGITDLIDDPESDLEIEGVDPVGLAGRVVGAIDSTTQPSDSLVINGWLLAARLEAILDATAGSTTDAPTGSITEIIARVIEARIGSAYAADGTAAELSVWDPEDDVYALGVLDRALGPSVLDTGHGRVGSLALAGTQSLDDRLPASLAERVRPHDMATLGPDVHEAIDSLEWADWLGAVIGLVREGAGASVEPDHLVDLVNRCSEVTSTIPKVDREQVEWAFAVCTEPWESLGVADEGRLTELGVWALPRMLHHAWMPPR